MSVNINSGFCLQVLKQQRPHKAGGIRNITMSSVQLPDISVELDETGHLSVDFLLPSGILVPLMVDFYASLDLIKKVESDSFVCLFVFSQLETELLSLL